MGCTSMKPSSDFQYPQKIQVLLPVHPQGWEEEAETGGSQDLRATSLALAQRETLPGEKVGSGRGHPVSSSGCTKGTLTHTHASRCRKIVLNFKIWFVL